MAIVIAMAGETDNRSFMTTFPARRLVAIATSTGGSIYLNDLLMKLPPEFDAGLVICHRAPQPLTRMIVQNLSVRYAKKIPFRVRFATDATVVSTGEILVAPLQNDLILQWVDGQWLARLVPPTGAGGPNLDRFLQSASNDQPASVLGVVLSGETTDGAEGLSTLRHAGGKTLSLKPDHWTATPQLPRYIFENRIAEKTADGTHLVRLILQLTSQLPSVP